MAGNGSLPAERQRGAQQASGLGDVFGNHVAADGDWLIVGAPREDVDLDGNGDFVGPGKVSAGTVYIYRRTPAGIVLYPVEAARLCTL